MPTLEEIEAMGIEEGEEYKFDYAPYEWVGEITMVRAALK